MLQILDLFLLALIAEGIDTAYGWQRRANISTGASLPSIRRLAARRLVREAEPGPRGRRRFGLTRAGRAEIIKLSQYTDAALQKDILDVESLFRLVSMAYANGERDLAQQLLNKAVEGRNKFLAQRKRCLPHSAPGSVIDFYSRSIACYERDRHEAALRSINSLLAVTKPEAYAKSMSARARKAPRQ